MSHLLITFETIQKIINTAKFIRTTVAPVGVSKKNETNIPAKKHTIEITTELIITL